MKGDKNIVDLDKPLNWFDRALAIVDKYRFKTIFKAVIVILIVAGVIGFINSPTWIFEQYQIWVDKEHTEAMALREQNDIKIHSITDRLNYRTNSSKTMIMEFHNGVENTPEALDKILTKLKADGYEFVTVSELIYWDNYKIDHTGKQILIRSR